MSFGYSNNVNNFSTMRQNTNFRARKKTAENNNLSPIEKIATKVDEEKKKKHNRTAMTVGGTVLGLSLLVTAFNPRISSKLIEKMRMMQYKTNRKIEKSKGDIATSKFYKFMSDAVGWGSNFLESINNVNSVKDTYYKKLCTEDKTFYRVHNMKRRQRLEKFDNVFRKIMQRPHELITKWGDNLAKGTVRKSYKTASKKMDNLEQLIIEYSNKLPQDKKAEINRLLSQIKLQREGFVPENIDKRFVQQENLMENLNQDIRAKWVAYRNGFDNQFVKKSEHFNQNLSFWAHDMMEPDKKIIAEEGKNRVEKLFGNKEGVKGSYTDVIETLSVNLSAEEKNLLNKRLKKAEKQLIKANRIECEEYFDKKRDLVLGSAPTDILSSVLMLGLCGMRLASTDDYDKKISRLLTGIFPTITGLGMNIVLTTMLFSGTKGLLYSFGASGILSLIGSSIDKERLAAKNKLPVEE